MITYYWNYAGDEVTDEIISGRFKVLVYTSWLIAWVSEAFIHHCPNCREDFFGWGSYCYYNYFGDYHNCGAPCDYAFLAQGAAIAGMDLVTISYAHNGALEGVRVVYWVSLKEWVCP